MGWTRNFGRMGTGLLLVATTLGLLGAPTVARATSGPTVSGTVIKAGGGAIGGADVELCRWSSGSADFSCNGAETETSSDGSFSFGPDDLTTGTTYSVRVSQDGYWVQWLGAPTSESPATATSQTSFTIQDSSTVINLDPITLAKIFHLTGKAVDATSAGISDLAVGLYASTGEMDSDTVLDGDSTDGSGNYSLRIPAAADGTGYRVLITDEAGGLAQSIQDVTLSQADKDLGSVTLTGQRATVGGLVTDNAANPLAGVTVTSFVWDDEESRFGAFATTSTGADGRYSVRVVAGERFTVRYETSDYSRAYLGGGTSLPTQRDDLNATRLAAAAGGTNDDLPTVALQPRYQVTGFVGTAANQPVDDVQVTAYPAGTTSGEDVSSGWTDSDGTFTLSLPGGSYDLVFDGADAEPGVSGTVVHGVTVGSSMALDDVLLPVTGDQVRGAVVDGSGSPVASARVTPYLWDAGSQKWLTGAWSFTDASGAFSVAVPDGATFTLAIRKTGYQLSWLGALAKPAEPDSTTPVARDGLAVGPVTLFAASDSLGKVAGQNLAYCEANVLAANDDESTRAVKLPYSLSFFGRAYTSLYVNNNGNVSFGRSLSEYTPGDLTSANQEAPMIAPFFADVDTRGDASWQVTYGASPDKKTFCVNWATVGYYSRHTDKLNVFQLLLTSRTGVSGRADGDFDITFNYDQIQWETGDASDGNNGLGGVSAAVGYTAGTGDPGTYFQLLGSLDNGAFLDGGPRALVANSLNSSQVGRYRFEVRNDLAAVRLGGLAGTLVDTGSHAVGGASVEACRLVNGVASGCQLTVSDVAGRYSFPSLPVGDYRIEISPPGTLRGTGLSATVQLGQTTDAGTTTLSAPEPMPTGTTLTNIGSSGGVPTVYWDEPLALSIPNPCSAGQTAVGTWLLRDSDGSVVRSGSLAASGNSLIATIPKLYPTHGSGRVETTVTCNGGPVPSPHFDIYIDPSGTVYDRYGVAVTGATVTIQRSDTSDGTYADLPEGSTLMSAGNRSNPITTDAGGTFHWDVQTGWYKVVAAKDGCPTATSSAMEVPPAQVDLALKLDCGSAPTPATAVSVSGTPAVGSTLTATTATFAGNVSAVSKNLVWQRDATTVATGSSYQPTLADAGHAIRVVETAQAPSIASNTAAGDITFATFEVASAPVSVDRPHLVAGTVGLSGTATVGTALNVTLSGWPADTSFSYQWLRDGSAISGATASSYVPSGADLGAKLSVRLTYAKDPYVGGGVTSAESSPVVAAVVPNKDFTAAPAPTISGKAKIGSTVTAAVGAWAPAPDLTAVQWLRGGVAIPGATKASYTVAPADAGLKLTVQVTATKAGYNQVVKASAPTATVPYLGKATAATPKISGTAKVGKTLKAKPGTWKPKGFSFSYQWFRSGVAISGATTASYRLTAADKGTKLTVKVTGTKPGYPTATKASKATKKVT